MYQFFGRGSRFTENGYTDSKPFIDVNGKPMIQRVIENLNIEFDEHFEFIIICLLEDYEKYDFSIFDDIIGHDFWEVICLPDVTEGAAQTILCAEPYIDNDSPLLSFNTDQLMDYDVEIWNTFLRYDGGIPCFKGDSTDWSYADVEKMVMLKRSWRRKSFQTIQLGYYFWTEGRDFVKYLNK